MIVARFALRSAGVTWVALSLLLGALFALRADPPRALLMRLRIGREVSAILYDPYREREIAIRPLAIGSLTLLWSPNGRWLIYRDQENRVAAYNLVTGRGQIVTGEHTQTTQPTRWSPDSRWLLFGDIRNGDLDYAAFDDFTAQAPRRLDTGIDAIQWSPDSRRLYVRDVLKAIGVIDVTCMETNTPCVRALVPHSRPIEQFAGWMPDGHDLMVISLAESNSRPRVFSLNPDDGSTRLILSQPLPGSAPVWTPDGQAIAAPLLLPASDDSELAGEGIAGLYVIDPETGTNMLVWAGITGDLSWTPDASLLAFDLISRGNNRHSVWIYDRASGVTRTLTPLQSVESLPSWGVFRGRDTTFAGLIVFDAALVIALWLTRRRGA